MRIGLISVNDQPTKAMAPGGTEVFVTSLAKALQRRGHEVTVIASGDSYIEGVRLLAGSPLSFAAMQDQLRREGKELPFSEKGAISNMLCLRNIAVAKANEEAFDILHENTGSGLISSIADVFSVPVVSTMHMPIGPLHNMPMITEMMIPNNVHLVTISKHQQAALSLPSHLIYNGIEVLEPAKQKRDGYVWVGRIDPTAPKGLEDAALATSATGDKLRYAGFVEDEEYFTKVIQPALHANVQRYPQFQNQQEKTDFYASAKAAVIPVKCEESFGFTFVEAMAAGTPVIAYAQGAATELIEDGKTGFLVNISDSDIRGEFLIKETGLKGIQAAIERFNSLSQTEVEQMQGNCRKLVREHYSVEVMAEAYERYYETLIGL